MAAYRTVVVKAKISRGGFANERTFAIQTAGGQEYIGLAPWIYCFDSHLARIQEEPADDRTTTGYVQARIISVQADGSYKLSLPGGDVCLVAKSQIKENPDIPAPPENYARVPV